MRQFCPGHCSVSGLESGQFRQLLRTGTTTSYRDVCQKGGFHFSLSLASFCSNQLLYKERCDNRSYGCLHCKYKHSLSFKSCHFSFIFEVSERSLLMESQSIGDSGRCQQYCDLTQGCLYWTWYRRHCDRLPCLEDHLTKINVCYLLSSCRLVGQKCSGCSSGSRVREEEGIKYWTNL